MPPHISICIPTYNRADLLVDTLKSIAAQTVQPYEVIILDNASTDTTAELISRFKNSNIRYIRHKKNIGMAQNYNACVQEARGEWMTFLPSDDIISPTWYEEWSKIISKTTADLYMSPLTVVDNDLHPLWVMPLFSENKLIRQPHVAKTFHDRGTPGVPPTALCVFNKKILKKLGPFDPAHGTEFDVRVMLRMFDVCDVYYLHRFLYALREHPYRAFEHEKETKQKQFLTRLERNFAIIGDLWKKNYQKNPKKRDFVHCAIFMNLCNINLYIARGELKTIVRSYQLAKTYIPDLFQYSQDWTAFVRYQWLFLKRVFMMRQIPSHLKKQISWIEDLRRYDSITP